MNFPPNTKRWQKVVESEIARGGYPFPPEYPLAVILVESRGNVGAVNPNSGASGMMQIMPGTLDGYNQRNKPAIPLSTLQSTSPSAAPEQIRVGLWVMGRYLTNGYKWITETSPDPAISDLIRIADLMYVAGPGRVRKKFKSVTNRTFDEMVNHDPDWQAFAHPRKVWKWCAEKNDAQWNIPEINSWVSGTTQPPDIVPPPNIAGPQNGFIGALLILAVASLLLSKKN